MRPSSVPHASLHGERGVGIMALASSTHPRSIPVPVPAPVTIPTPHPPPRMHVAYPTDSYRLSSSAPSHADILTAGTLPLPDRSRMEYDSKPYYVDNTPSSLCIRSSGANGYSRPLLNPGPPLSRNMSAPSLGDVMNPRSIRRRADVDRDVFSSSRSRPVPVAGGRIACMSGMSGGYSPPVYGSPPVMGRRSGVGSRVKGSGRRDSYTRFTAEEENMLMEGVRIHGVGNWKKILNSYRFHWKRTAVDLKDKYRNMTRAKLRRMQASGEAVAEAKMVGAATAALSNGSMGCPSAITGASSTSQMSSASSTSSGGAFEGSSLPKMQDGNSRSGRRVSSSSVNSVDGLLC